MIACQHIFPDGTRCELAEHSAPGVAAVHGYPPAGPTEDAVRRATPVLAAAITKANGRRSETGVVVYDVPAMVRLVLAAAQEQA